MDRSFPKRGARNLVPLCVLFAMLLGLFPASPPAHAAGATLNWQWRNSVPEVFGLSGIAYGNGQFVAVGGQTILTSTDGLNWTPRNSPTTHLSGIAYGGGLFVVVGYGGTILASNDGADWTVRRSGTADEWLRGVVYGDGRFVAVGYKDVGQGGDIILTSTDGVDWTVRKPATTKTLKLTDIAFGNGRFVALSTESTILVSADGLEWTAARQRLEASPSGTPTLNGVAFGDGKFVAVGDQGTILTSTDGENWTPRKSGTTDWLPGVTYVNGRFVTFGSGGMLTSTDGTDWIPWAATMQRLALAGAVFGNGRYVVVGTRRHCVNCTTAAAILTSEDGTNWVQPGYGVKENLEDVTYGNGLFVAVGWNAAILSSPDGANWIIRKLGTDTSKYHAPLYPVVYRDGRFIAISMGGTNLTSVDGVNWTEDGSATPDHRADASYGNGIFVAVDRKDRPDDPGTGMILTSKDGAEWTARKTPIPNPVIDVVYGNGQFVALATEGEILTSKDGIRWTARKSGTTHAPQSIAFGDGLFVAVGTSWSNEGIILTSSDAVHWTAHTLPGRGLEGVAYGNGEFVAVGGLGAIITAESPTKAAVIKVYVGGQRLTFDVPPAIESGRTLVPMRAILEALGAAVEWDGTTRTVTATKQGVTIALTIGQEVALVNGRPVNLDVPARIIEGRTLVPLRFLSENLGETVTWDGNARTIKITMTQ